MTSQKILPLAGIALCCLLTVNAEKPITADDITWTTEKPSVEEVANKDTVSKENTERFATLPPTLKLPSWVMKSEDTPEVKDDRTASINSGFKIIEESIVFDDSKNVEEDKPTIAIVIDDMGLSLEKSQAVVDLPAPLTLAYLPYGKKLPEQTKNASEQGHELMVHMPMEPLDEHIHPGPNALLGSLTKEEFLDNLEHNLAQFEGYVGINNHMGSLLSQDPEALDMVMSHIKDKGLFYLDSRTTAASIGERTARKHDILTSRRDVFLDHEETEEFVANSLATLEQKAREQGSAIAIGHPKKVTVDALKAWIPEAEARGFRIVPVSQVLAQRQEEEINAQRIASAAKATPDVLPE